MKKSTLIGGLVAGIIMFFFGWLVYGIALSGFFEGQTINNVSKSEAEMNFIVLFVGCVVIGLTLAHVYGKWARGQHSFGHGFQFGAILGLGIQLGVGLIWWSTRNVMELPGYLVDSIVRALEWGLSAGVIGLIYNKFGDD